MSDVVVPGDTIAPENSKNVSGPLTYLSNGNIISSAYGVVKTSSNADGTVVFSVEAVKPPGVVPTTGSVVFAKVASLTRCVVRCNIVAVNNIPLAGPFKGLIRREDIRATQRDQAEPADCFRPGDLIRARVINLIGPGVVVHAALSDSEKSNTSTAFLAAQAVSCSVDTTSYSNITGSNSVCILSTAEPDLGVVLGLGRSPFSTLVELFGKTSGSPLIPVSWTEMLCPHTLTRYSRKVARVPDELVTQLVCSKIK